MRRALSVVALLALPGAAHACAVCGAAVVERNQSAFLGTTILLSLLPLALVGGSLWWVRRHAGERLAGEFLDRDLLAGAPVGPLMGATREPSQAVIAMVPAGPAGGGEVQRPEMVAPRQADLPGRRGSGGWI